MARPRVLVLVLAGGAGGRLELLTSRRAKPAVPFAGNYRLIDVPLSNAMHAGLSDVWVVEQYHAASLEHHLSNGRPWDLDRTLGGLLVLPPQRGDDRQGWSEGTAEALWRNAPMIREFDAQALVVLSADAVYRLDYDALVREHLEAGAMATLVTTRVEPGDAGRYGVVTARDGRLTGYAYKPDDLSGDLVSNEVFVFDPVPVLDALDQLADKAGEEGLQDLGTALLPQLVEAGDAREHRFEDYWSDVGTVDAYHAAHMDVLPPEPAIDLDEAHAPFRTRSGSHGPVRIERTAEIHDSLIAPGSRVAGQVERSVLSPRVVVEHGALVRESVLLPGAVIRKGARVIRTIVDDRVVVGEDAEVGGDGEVTLLGLATEVAAGTRLPAGARHPEDD